MGRVSWKTSWHGPLDASLLPSSEAIEHVAVNWSRSPAHVPPHAIEVAVSRQKSGCFVQKQCDLMSNRYTEFRGYEGGNGGKLRSRLAGNTNALAKSSPLGDPRNPRNSVTLVLV
jgi:hypothetical protein